MMMLLQCCWRGKVQIVSALASAWDWLAGGVLTSSGCRKILGVRRERISVNTSVLLMMTREAVLSCYYYMLSSV
jgi:hypothetical protein